MSFLPLDCEARIVKDMLPEYCNDLTVTDVTRFSDLQVWFLAFCDYIRALVTYFFGSDNRYVSAGFRVAQSARETDTIRMLNIHIYSNTFKPNNMF